MDYTRRPFLSGSGDGHLGGDVAAGHSRVSDTDFSNLSMSTRPSRSPSQASSQAQRSKDGDIRRNYELAPIPIPDVATEMEKWYSTTDRYGFLDDGEKSTGPKQAAIEKERSEKWARMAIPTVEHGENMHIFTWSSKFVKRIYKGIPDCWRRDAWYFLCTSQVPQARSDISLRQLYKDLLIQPTPHEHQIDLDIPRTMHGHIMFRQRYGTGQRALFNILCAFSNYDGEVGYCQGMTSIAAMILLYCEEEKAFIILVHLFMRDHLHDLFIPGFPTLLECFYIQTRLIQRHLPKIHRHLQKLNISTDIYSTRWYITLFTGGVVQYHTLLRIWDVYFLHGFEIFFSVALALLKLQQSRLLAGDMDECMSILGSTMAIADDDYFIKLVKRYHDRHASPSALQTLRQAYKQRNQ